VKERHPSRLKKDSFSEDLTQNRIIPLKLDILYKLGFNGDGWEYVLGEVKSGPTTENSKISRRLGQIITYIPCLEQIGCCNDIAMIYPTLPSKREMDCYLEKTAQEPYSLHILTITERDYLQTDIKRRVSSAKRSGGRHIDAGWEEELKYLREIAKIAGLLEI